MCVLCVLCFVISIIIQLSSFLYILTEILNVFKFTIMLCSPQKTIHALRRSLTFSVKKQNTVTKMSMLAMEDVVYDMDYYMNQSEEYLYDNIGERQCRKVLTDKFEPNPHLWYLMTMSISLNFEIIFILLKI